MATRAAYDGRRVFRRGRVMLAMIVGATALFAAGFVFSYRTQGWSFQAITFAAITVVFGFGGIIESLVERIELQADAMVIRRLWGTRRVPIGEIDKVAEAKGVSPILLLKNGERIRLPDVAQSLGNSTRAWLRGVCSDTI